MNDKKDSPAKLNPTAKEFVPKGAAKRIDPTVPISPSKITLNLAAKEYKPKKKQEEDSPPADAPKNDLPKKAPEVSSPPITVEKKKEEKQTPIPENGATTAEKLVQKIPSKEEEDEEEVFEERRNKDPIIAATAVLPTSVLFSAANPVEKDKPNSLVSEKQPVNVYSIEYLKTFKPKCQKRPKDMRPIDINVRSKLNINFKYEQVPRSEMAETVRNLRILLNKLAKDNFARIADTILNNFEYNEEILQELAKILYNKCVKEPNYISIYMQLVDQLFYKFKKPKEEKKEKSAAPTLNLDFRRLFLENCQATFENQNSDEFLKDLPKDLDEEEKKTKLMQRVFGNMKLIGELYIRGAISDKIVKECIENLYKEEKEDNVENICHLLLTIGQKVYEYFAFEAKLTTIVTKKPSIRMKCLSKEIFDDYLDKLIALKQSDKICSRIKFMIQDVIDARNKEWSYVFNQFPVAKQPGKLQPDIIAYRKKQSIEKEQDMGLQQKAEEARIAAAPNDPKIEKHEKRKKSMNEQNVFGRNFEKYQKNKIDEKIRLKYNNILEEYLHSNLLEEAKEGINEAKDAEGMDKCIAIGNFFLYGFSKTPKEFQRIIKFVSDLAQNKFIVAIDVEEGIIVALANFYDTLIDFPNATEMFTSMISEMMKLGFVGQDMMTKCMAHIETMKKQLEEEYKEQQVYFNERKKKK